MIEHVQYAGHRVPLAIVQAAAVADRPMMQMAALLRDLGPAYADAARAAQNEAEKWSAP